MSPTLRATLSSCLLAGALLAVLALPARGAARPSAAVCAVGLQGSSYLLILRGPHARAQCAADVRRGVSIGVVPRRPDARGLVLVCAGRYPDGTLHRIYARTRADSVARLGCILMDYDLGRP